MVIRISQPRLPRIRRSHSVRQGCISRPQGKKGDSNVMFTIYFLLSHMLIVPKGIDCIYHINNNKKKGVIHNP